MKKKYCSMSLFKYNQKEDWFASLTLGACELCNQIPILTCINRQWNNRAEEFDGKVMLPAGHSPI